ncbi:MAG: hypothetical protein HC849_29395 [Oscillatoriales cyanobacterium RU_3_3]|nr:hypothetical protein [Microcoleus sp. SU_5_6]NJL68628.1 hypothetical protein [Microcoleus sp. SM1_3_4]NJM63357.1 hypothetical protein [Oscillatoriales cyanobacterium RU_3_3]
MTPSFLHRRLSTIDDRRTIASGEDPTNCQLSTVNCQLSTFNFQLS